MPEGRIAHVVRQAGGRHNRSYFEKGGALFGILVHQAAGNVVSHGSANTGNLQTVGKAVVYKYIARQRKYLRLIL
jgi:hypothetical protein